MTWQRIAAAALVVLGMGWPAQAQDKAPPKEEREGGILGTGIIGTITALGSIEVNGLRVVFADDMMAESGLGPMPAADLRPGDVVVAEVMPQGGDWQATRLEEFLALVGPVAADGTILGARIDLGGESAVTESGWAAVSGLWKDDVLMASRIREVPPQETALVRGTFMDGRIGGVNVTLPADVPQGAALAVRLRPDGAPVAYRQGLFSGPVERVIAEGYLSPPSPEGHYTVLGSGLMAQTDQPQMIDPARRGLFCATPGTGDAMAQIVPMGSGDCR